MRSKKDKIVETIVNDLRRQIVRGDYLCGEFLPPIRELAQLYSAANQTISAALDALVELGMICRTGRGCQVVLDPNAPQHRPILVLYQRPQLENYTQMEVLAAATARLAELKLNYRIVDSRQHLPAPREIADAFSGVLMAMALVDAGPAFVEALDEALIPNVVANLESQWNVTATRVDRAETTARAVRIMLDMGHRDIALLIRDPGLYFYRQALDGYRRQLAVAGIPFREELVIICPEYDLFSTYRTVCAAIRRGVKFTGMITGRDSQAHAAVEALHEFDLEVGRDISIIGYDDLSWPRKERILTTFVEPCRQLGSRAVDLLYERVLTGWQPPKQEVFDAEFLLRRTLAPCRISP